MHNWKFFSHICFKNVDMIFFFSLNTNRNITDLVSYSHSYFMSLVRNLCDLVIVPLRKEKKLHLGTKWMRKSLLLNTPHQLLAFIMEAFDLGVYIQASMFFSSFLDMYVSGKLYWHLK
jgi:hypothetical protein